LHAGNEDRFLRRILQNKARKYKHHILHHCILHQENRARGLQNDANGVTVCGSPNLAEGYLHKRREGEESLIGDKSSTVKENKKGNSY
jgi:hypothetical protein